MPFFEVWWAIGMFVVPGFIGLTTDLACNTPNNHCVRSVIDHGPIPVIRDDQLPPGVPRFEYDRCKADARGVQVNARHPDDSSMFP